MTFVSWERNKKKKKKKKKRDTTIQAINVSRKKMPVFTITKKKGIDWRKS